MALLPVLQYPHPALAAKAERIDVFGEDLQRLAADMAETMYAAPGVGLAANQVGILKRIIVIDVTDDKTGLRVLCNPEIIEASEEVQDHEEGCLSLMGTRKAQRFRKIKVRYQDERFRVRFRTLEGWTAQIAQHEIDHCNGVLI